MMIYHYQVQIKNIRSEESLKDKVISFNIIPKYNVPSFYSMKVTIPESNNLIRVIDTETIYYCYIQKISDVCYFAIPIQSYESTNQVLLYAMNEDYPKKLNVTFSSISSKWKCE